MKQYFKPAELLEPVAAADMGLVYTSVQRLEVTAPLHIESKDTERCYICIAGKVGYACEGQSGVAEMKDMLYLPMDCVLELTPEADGVMMEYSVPCERKTKFAHLHFSEIDADDRHKHYGKVEQGTVRDVWNFIDESFDSPRFLTGLCCGRDGGWTAWPPHEHAVQREEVYVYFNMGDSFGAQFVYTDLAEPDVVALVREGDFISVPKGYHPNVGCPCGGIFYGYVMVSTTAEDRNFMDLSTQKIYGDRLE